VANSNHYDAFLRLKQKYDRDTRPPDFVVGQRVYLESPPLLKNVSAKLQPKFPKLYEIVSRHSYTNFKVKDIQANKILKFPVHVSRMKHAHGDRSPLNKYGPYSNTDLPPIPEEGPCKEPQYSADDFTDNFDNIFEDSAENNPPQSREKSSPDTYIELEDETEVTSSPEKLGDQNDEEYSIFRSLEPSEEQITTETKINDPPHIDPPENDPPKYIPHDAIKEIKEKKMRDGITYYKIHFSDPSLGTRFVHQKFIDPKLLTKD